MMVNLFGEDVSDPVKTWEQEYREYLASAKWKKKRSLALYHAGNKCEVCGNTKWVSPLEVHHKTYINFKNEPMDELMVVCRKCHKLEDEKRRREMMEDRKERRIRRIENGWFSRLDGWASKVWGDDWTYRVSREEAEYRFDQFLQSIGE